MHIQDFFQNFLKLFLVGLYGDCTVTLNAQYAPSTAKPGLSRWQIVHPFALPTSPSAASSPPPPPPRRRGATRMQIVGLRDAGVRATAQLSAAAPYRPPPPPRAYLRPSSSAASGDSRVPGMRIEVRYNSCVAT